MSAGESTVPALTDAAAREQAVTDVARNLCVLAGAGSGKTSLLVERILHLLLARDLPLERIVAITFTEKAAAEMRQRLRDALATTTAALDGAVELTAAARAAGDGEAQRVLARLARAAPPGLTTGALRARAAAALEADGTLTTIHSFALRLLRRHPIEAGIPAGVEIDLGEGFRRHAGAHLPALLEDTLADPARGATLQRVLADVAVDDLLEVAIDLAWLPADAVAPAPDPQGAIAPLRPRLLELERVLGAGREQAKFAKNAGLLAEQWDAVLVALRQLLETGLGRDGRLELPATVVELLQKKLSGAQSVTGVTDLDALRDRLAEAQKLLKRLLTVDESFIERVLDAVRPLAAELRDSFLRSGFISADGALALAAGLLAGHPEVRRAEGRAIAQLLVDEFQDTDPLQCELVLFLCEDERGAPARRAHDVKLAPGRLFLVGDPKQSIYRFRGADLDVYASATDLVVAQGGARLDLTTSFRSPPRLVEPVNALFSAWADARNDAEAPFTPLRASRARGATAPGFELWSVARADGLRTAGARREAEGRVIAEWIAAQRSAGVATGRIVLLLRSLSDVRRYLQPLRDLRIPFALSGGRTFVQRSEVGELASLLIAGADPQDEIASLGALRSTLLAVPDSALLEAKRAHGSLRWTDLREAADPAVRAAARALDAFHGELSTRPVVEAVERFVEGSPLLAIAASARDGEQRIANLRKLARDVAAAAERDGRPLAEVARDAIARRKRPDGESEGSLADVDLDAVRILTIHKAKGLEFDVVVVGDVARPGKSPRAADPSVKLVPTAQGARIALRIGGAGNVASVLRTERDALHEEAESKRLLYVATTRAKERLVLVIGDQEKGGAPKWVEPLGAFGYARGAQLPDGPLRHGDVSHRNVVMPERRSEPRLERPAEIAALAEAVARFERAVAAARAPANGFARPSAHHDEDDDARVEAAAREEAAPAVRDLAKAVGTACHLALARSGPRRPPTAAEIDFAARVVAADAPFAAQEIAAEATELLASAPARALLASLAQVEPVAVELPITLEEGTQRWRGSIDLLFKDPRASGRLVVADWKSDREQDLDALAARYRPQLAIYARAITRALALAEAPALELLLLRHGRRLPLG